MKADFDPQVYLDEWGYKNARLMARYLRDDQDVVLLVIGRERMGKSTLACLWCAAVDKEFDTQRVVFPSIELKKAITDAPKYSAVLQDEGAETWLSTDASSSDAREMTRVFMEIGYKNLFCAIVIPDFTMVQRYLKGHRAKGILRVVSRGSYAFYSDSRAKQIKIDYQSKKVIFPRPNYIGHFYRIPKGCAFWQEYLRKKGGHLGHKSEDPWVTEARLRMERFKRQTVTPRVAAEILGVKTYILTDTQSRARIKKATGVEPIKLATRRYVWCKRDLRRLLAYFNLGKAKMDKILEREE